MSRKNEEKSLAEMMATPPWLALLRESRKQKKEKEKEAMGTVTTKGKTAKAAHPTATTSTKKDVNASNHQHSNPGGATTTTTRGLTLGRSREEWHAKRNAASRTGASSIAARAVTTTLRGLRKNRLPDHLLLPRDEEEPAGQEAPAAAADEEIRIVSLAPEEENDGDEDEESLNNNDASNTRRLSESSAEIGGAFWNHRRDSDLAQAKPVSDEPVLVEAQEVDPRILQQQETKTEERKQCRRIGCGVVVVCFTVIGVSLVVAHNQRNKNDEGLSTIFPTASPSFSISETPSLSPSAALDPILELLPSATLAGLEIPESSQSRARDWLMTHQNISVMEDWRKVQLFALATIYFEWDGPNWRDGLNEDWLDDTKSECYWFSTDGSAIGDLTAKFNGNQGNSSCNAKGEYQLLSLQGSFNNRLVSGGSIPQEVALLTNLVSIDLEWANLNTSLEAGVYPAVSSLPKLEVLRLGGVSLTGTIPSEFGTMTTLRHLRLRANDLTGFIPSEIGQLSGLDNLNMMFNLLSGPIPSQLGQLNNLTELVLAANGFSGFLPTELGTLTSLELLTIQDNKLGGAIPPELGSMKALQLLSLSMNTFVGPIPEDWGLLTNLIFLALSGNTLSGAIPSQLGLLHNIDAMWFKYNLLSGILPTEIGLMTSLTDVTLARNQLHGPLPSELGLITGAKWLTFSKNRFSGQIPSQLGRMSWLEWLHLDGNMLSGQIPHNWASLEFNSSAKPDLGLSESEQQWEPGYLYDLDISDNALLTGSIPRELCLMLTQSCSIYEFDHNENAWKKSYCLFNFDCTDLLCGCGSDCPCKGEPTRAPTMPPTQLPCEAGFKAFEFHLMTDSYAKETEWSLVDCHGAKEAGHSAGYYNSSTYYLDQFCVPVETSYVLTIKDTEEDGICCDYGEGWYEAHYGGEKIGGGGKFLSNESWTFGGNCSRQQ